VGQLDVTDRLLRDAGFTYDDRLDAWFNLPAGRAISGAMVRTSTPDWLAGWLRAGGAPSRKPSETEKREALGPMPRSRRS
jgi:hypothetical protein